MHSLPRSQEEIINNYIREWKKRHYKKCTIEIIEELPEEVPEEDFEVDLIELEIMAKEIKVKKFNRAKVKKETKELIDAYFEENQR